MTANIRATMPTFRPSGPTVSMAGQTRVKLPVMGTEPIDGRSPVTPFNAAGVRTEPPVSEPTAPTHISAATEAPAPPLEPLGILSRSHGLRVEP